MKVYSYLSDSSLETITVGNILFYQLNCRLSYTNQQNLLSAVESGMVRARRLNAHTSLLSITGKQRWAKSSYVDDFKIKIK